MEKMPTNELTEQEILRTVEELEKAFTEVAPTILENAGKSKSKKEKADGSQVTETDENVERMIKEKLAKGKVPVLGEESGYDDENLPPYCWLVDPIDGTKAFIKNIPTYTSMGALIQNRETIASVIFNPSTGETYTAIKGKGAYKNGKRIELDKKDMPKSAICKDVLIDPIDHILESTGVKCENAPAGGGFGFTMVLDNKVAARFNIHSGGYTHDYAPGGLLVKEAGGVLVPVLDSEYTFRTRSFVAAHPDLEDVLTAHVGELRQLEASR